MNVSYMKLSFLELIFLAWMKKKGAWYYINLAAFFFNVTPCLTLLLLPLCFIICLLQRLELERKTTQLAERKFEEVLAENTKEVFNMKNKIKSLNRERDILADDSENRTKLAMKKLELENHRKKLKKMSVTCSGVV